MLSLFLCLNHYGCNFGNTKQNWFADLEMEKLWVAQCGCRWLCTTVAMGMTIPNLWKTLVVGLRETTIKN